MPKFYLYSHGIGMYLAGSNENMREFAANIDKAISFPTKELAEKYIRDQKLRSYVIQEVDDAKEGRAPTTAP